MLLWLKRELEAEYVKQYIDMLKQTINIWKIMIKTLHHHALRICKQFVICKQ